MDKTRTPVLIGAAQLTHREKTKEQIDPVDFMAQVSRKALKDATLDDSYMIDTMYVVNCLSKHLTSPCDDLAKNLNMTPSTTGYTGIGGAAPQWFVNLAAENIYSGKSELVLICGAESFYTHERLHHFSDALSRVINETKTTSDSRYIGDIRNPNTELEAEYALTLPVQTYSLFENALRGHWGKTMKEHMDELSLFCSNFSSIAYENPFSWSKKALSPEAIATINDNNQMVAFPYTKAMCANMSVNQAAAVIMTNLAKAESMGVPKDKIIFLRGYAAAEDNFYVSQRPELWASPSVTEAVDHALMQIPLSIDHIKYFDFYSCFPCVPRIVRDMLNISPHDPRPLTITGGLPYFGGPGNNYTLHAICAMVDTLRKEPDEYGLVQTISWFLSKHVIGIYSATPGDTAWHPAKPKKKEPYPLVHVVKKLNGKATIESFILIYDHTNTPCAATVVGRDTHLNRFIARVKPEMAILAHMASEETVGTSGMVQYDSKTACNWFYFK
jgi:acetyl-CoA C-acetyltransferase